MSKLLHHLCKSTVHIRWLALTYFLVPVTSSRFGTMHVKSDEKEEASNRSLKTIRLSQMQLINARLKSQKPTLYQEYPCSVLRLRVAGWKWIEDRDQASIALP